jgi:hypothetical protein
MEDVLFCLTVWVIKVGVAADSIGFSSRNDNTDSNPYACHQAKSATILVAGT